MVNDTVVSLAAPAQVRDPLLDDRAWMASTAFLVAKANGLVVIGMNTCGDASQRAATECTKIRGGLPHSRTRNQLPCRSRPPPWSNPTGPRSWAPDT